MSARRRSGGLLLGIASAFLALAPGGEDGCDGASACAASPPARPGWVQVEGGEEGWHAESRFGLSWESSSQAGQPVLATHYRALDAEGHVVVYEKRVDAVTHTAHVVVPNVPGVYTFEVWWEGEGGQQGLPARAALRFDEVRPGAV